MKAITLRQPWAGLVAGGHKLVETRDWRTSFRGKLAIHAALRRRDLHAQALAAAAHAGLCVRELPMGALVATAELVDIVPTSELVFDVGTRGWQRRFGVVVVNSREQLFGDLSPGRYAWLLGAVTPLHPPVPYRAAKFKLWEVDL